MTETEKTMLIDQLCKVSMDISGIANILAGVKPIDLPSETLTTKPEPVRKASRTGKRATTPTVTTEAKASEPEETLKTGQLPDTGGAAGQDTAGPAKADTAQAGIVPETLSPDPAPAATCTFDQVRALLVEKARNGFRAEVKALLTTHGVKQLSDIKDPAELAQLMAEAEVI